MVAAGWTWRDRWIVAQKARFQVAISRLPAQGSFKLPASLNSSRPGEYIGSVSSKRGHSRGHLGSHRLNSKIVHSTMNMFIVLCSRHVCSYTRSMLQLYCLYLESEYIAPQEQDTEYCITMYGTHLAVRLYGIRYIDFNLIIK